MFDVIRALTKTLDYLEIFARFKDTENIEEVEKLLSAHTELELFERSQLGMICLPPFLLQLVQENNVSNSKTFLNDTGSLCCDNAEEAKSLIPSLQNKISDSELQELLDEMTKLRNFVE